jgi:hypothetical protein
MDFANNVMTGAVPVLTRGALMRDCHLVRAISVLAAVTAAGIIFGTTSNKFSCSPATQSTEDSSSTVPWNAKQLVEPSNLAQELEGPAGSKPLVVCVGFDFLYQSAHVPGAVLYGPGREPSGLKALEDAARGWPRNRNIVIYCGCCPMKQCPNLQPAYRTLAGMGFSRLRILDLEHDFRQDWLQKGLPTEKGSGK